MNESFKFPSPEERHAVLTQQRNVKMARSAHAYVRGNTSKFYEWLETNKADFVPQGPPIWICGDCHAGNLGPIADANGRIAIQIRDLDQTVIGNPAHDLIRLGLSLSSAARGSDLPGITTVRILEQIMEGYANAFDNLTENPESTLALPESVEEAMKKAYKRSWKHLAEERIGDTTPSIPLGKNFWPLSKEEKKKIDALFTQKEVENLVTLLRSRKEGSKVKVLDAAYWMKGCSSLGNLRYAVLLGVGKAPYGEESLCLMDIKEAVRAVAMRTPKVKMPRDNGLRVITGAKHLSPFLGKRMLATHLMDRAVFLRELLPQDLKIEIEELTTKEAMKAARFLALVVGKAHARQMDEATRQQWQAELSQKHTKTLDAPSWLWSNIVDLLTSHEAGYLEHCRKYALAIEQQH